MAGKLIFQMDYGGHLGFIRITRVTQSFHLGNKAEFVLGPHEITNHQNKFIWKKFLGSENVKSTKWSIRHTNEAWLTINRFWSCYAAFKRVTISYLLYRNRSSVHWFSHSYTDLWLSLRSHTCISIVLKILNEHKVTDLNIS